MMNWFSALPGCRMTQNDQLHCQDINSWIIYSKTFSRSRPLALVIMETYITSKGCDIWGIDHLQHSSA